MRGAGCRWRARASRRHRWSNRKDQERKHAQPINSTDQLLTDLAAVLALAAFAALGCRLRRRLARGAVVFSKSSTKTVKERQRSRRQPGQRRRKQRRSRQKTTTEGGLFAVRDGHLNQLTEDPTDTEPAFSAGRPDDRLRPRRRRLLDARRRLRPAAADHRRRSSTPRRSSRPNGNYVVFERRAAAGAPRATSTRSASAAEAVHAR